MKIFKTAFAMAAAVALASCSDNDDKQNIIIPGPPIGVEVKYEVVASADIITQISYKMGDGDLFYGHAGPDGTNTSWYSTMIALYNKMPQMAFLQTKCRNTTGTVQTCTLNIYREEVLIETITAPVALADEDDETQDDIVTTTITKAIGE